MKTFTEYLTEKKDHIIKKMPNLSQDEKEVVIDFFKKKPNMENRIDWNKWRKLHFGDFQEVMADTKSSIKRKAQKLRHKGIKGLKEGEDYIHIKTKNKEYLVYIPLNPQAAKVIASAHIGGCHGKWCIANTQAVRYYKSEAKKQNKIPIMVVGKGTKYTIMMKRNCSFEVWAADNFSAEFGEAIPDFSIRKELCTSKLNNLYDEIVHDIWTRKQKAPENIDPEYYKEAVDAYEELGNAVESYIGDRIESLEEYHKHNEKVIIDTIELYEEKLIELEEELKAEENKNEKDAIKSEIDDVNKVIDDIEEYKDNIGYEFEEYVNDNNDIEWSADIFYEEYIFEGLYSSVSFTSDDYDPYFEFAEDYLDVDEDSRTNAEYGFYESEMEYVYVMETPDGEVLLDDLDLPHPSKAKKRQRRR